MGHGQLNSVGEIHESARRDHLLGAILAESLHEQRLSVEEIHIPRARTATGLFALSFGSTSQECGEVDIVEHQLDRRGVFQSPGLKDDVSEIYALKEAAIVSLVGDKMRHQPGLAGRMFSTLGRGGVNVLAIAQGAAETNISAVVDDAEVRSAVGALHEAFPLARRP